MDHWTYQAGRELTWLRREAASGGGGVFKFTTEDRVCRREESGGEKGQAEREGRMEE
jgi:hypothetical protein